MPEINGPEVARRLTIERPSIRVLYLSGYTDHALLRRGVLEATENFLQKPFTTETLLRKVREVIG
jgi:FixJ family two-component response regulator